MPRGRKTSLIIQLTPEVRTILETWQQSTSIRAGLARRGRIILMLAEGASVSHVARAVGIRRRFVYKWAGRFLQEGIPGLADRPGRGQSPASAAPLDAQCTN